MRACVCVRVSCSPPGLSCNGSVSGAFRILAEQRGPKLSDDTHPCIRERGKADAVNIQLPPSSSEHAQWEPHVANDTASETAQLPYLLARPQ